MHHCSGASSVMLGDDFLSIALQSLPTKSLTQAVPEETKAKAQKARLVETLVPVARVMLFDQRSFHPLGFH